MNNIFNNFCKIIPSFLIVLLGTLSFDLKALAQEDFKVEYDILYDIKPDTEAQVTQSIQIVNIKNDVTATNYTLSVKQMRIYDLQAMDELGKMDIIENIEGITTTIRTKFNNTIVGKGRDNKFELKYKTKDIASKIGEIYTIKIPKVSSLDTVREYNVTLAIPKTYGPLIFITPTPLKQYDQDNKFYFEFSKESLENKGISASFGNYQLVNYKLNYQLQNDKFYSVISDIALPPDIQERQQVNHKTITPEPQHLYEDQDGNLIAQYTLKPNQKLEIELIGTVRILGKQITPEFGAKIDAIPKKLKDLYTQEQKFWDYNNPEILSIRNRLYDKELTVSQNALKIYNYVIENLDYDYSVSQKGYVQRNGASAALTKDAPSACMEFTDTFIAIARSMGIPSRELDGYAINYFDRSTNPLSIKLKSGDQLHAWPEFYDPNFGWVPIDPTWGDTSKLDFFTKLDNSHFVFAVKGIESEYPLPAGMYRFDDTKKLVSVEISQDKSEDDFQQNVSLFKLVNVNPSQLIKKNAHYYAKNESGLYIYNLYGYKLLPYQIKRVYLPNNLEKLTLYDINNKESNLNFIYLQKNPVKYLISPQNIILSFLLGLGLCGFFYYLIAVRGILKKLYTRLVRLPRGLNRQRNQH